MIKVTTQAELARQFARGYDSGSASNLAIVATEDETRLVGYGWATYATRDDAGKVTVYEAGWCDWARSQGGNTTQSQFAKIREGLKEAFNARDDEHPSFHALCEYVEDENARPTHAEPPASVDMIGYHRGR